MDPAIQAVFDATREQPQRATPLDGPGLLDAVLTALTVEVGHLLDEHVVASPDQVDLCMILGAGWPSHLGGLTPLLDRTGYSERVLGRATTSRAPGHAVVWNVRDSTSSCCSLVSLTKFTA